MKFIFNLLKKPIINLIINYLDKPEVKQEWVNRINNKYDIKNKTEIEERALISAGIDIGFDEIKSLLRKI